MYRYFSSRLAFVADRRVISCQFSRASTNVDGYKIIREGTCAERERETPRNSNIHSNRAASSDGHFRKRNLHASLAAFIALRSFFSSSFIYTLSRYQFLFLAFFFVCLRFDELIRFSISRAHFLRIMDILYFLVCSVVIFRKNTKFSVKLTGLRGIARQAFYAGGIDGQQCNLGA